MKFEKLLANRYDLLYKNAKCYVFLTKRMNDEKADCDIGRYIHRIYTSNGAGKSMEHYVI